MAEALFRLADAARRRPPSGPPPTRTDFEPDATRWQRTGVPLARVWAEQYGGRYQVRLIDATPSGRRPFGPDPAATPRSFVGWPWADVGAALARFGVPAVAAAETPSDGKTLLRIYQEEQPFVPGVSVIALAHPDAATGRVFGFRPAATVPPSLPAKILTGTLPETKLYWPDPAATGPEPARFADLPPAADLLTGVSDLPAGGLVRVGVDLKTAIDFGGGGRPYDLYYLDGMEHAVRHIGATAVSRQIVATVRIPAVKQPGGDVTILAQATLGDTTHSEAVTVTADGAAHPVVFAPLDAGVVILSVGGPLGGGSQKTIYYLSPVDAPQVIGVTLTATPAQELVEFGTLRYASSRPTVPDKDDGQRLKLITTDKKTFSGLAAVKSSVNKPELVVWLRDATDKWRRHLDLPAVKDGATGKGPEFADTVPTFVTVPVTDLKLEAKVVVAAVNAADQAKLTLTNNTGAAFKLTGGSVQQSDAELLAIPAADLAVGSAKDFTFQAANKSVCRVLVKFKPADGPEQSAGIDVTPPQ